MKHDLISSSSPKEGLCALALMAKVPFARLTPPLSPEEAATLSTCFLRDMTPNVLDINGDGTEGVVLYTSANAERFLHDLLPDGFKLVAQRGETLASELTDAHGGNIDPVEDPTYRVSETLHRINSSLVA